MNIFDLPKINNSQKKSKSNEKIMEFQKSSDDFIIFDNEPPRIVSEIVKNLASVDQDSSVPDFEGLSLPQKIKETFERYLNIAESCLSDGRRIPILVISGYSGMGKETVVRSIGKKLGLNVTKSSSRNFTKDSLIICNDHEIAESIHDQGYNTVLVVDDEIKPSMFGNTWYFFDTTRVQRDNISVRLNEEDFDECGENILKTLVEQQNMSISHVDLKKLVRILVEMDVDFSPYNMNYIVKRTIERQKTVGDNFIDCALNIAEEIKNSRPKPDMPADIIKPKKQVDDLIVSTATKESVIDIINSAKNIGLLKPFEFAKKNGIGDSAKVLFYGPPGTGKTAMAEAIAKALEKPLWVADVSKIEGKYVGESEKNIKKLFRKAQTSGAVLFLDECDGLLANRESNISEHRLSLMSLMLQLIWDFKGILIMATNFKDNLDKAMDRRLTYQVKFELPTDEQAGLILKNLLLPDAPLKEVDFEQAVAGLGLSGGHLVNVVEGLYSNIVTGIVKEVDQAALRRACEVVAERSKEKKVGKPFGFGG